MKWINDLRSLVSRHQLVMAIALTIFIALIMTVLSLSLYVSSGTLQLDLSRPGYESARKELIKPQNDADFASNGPVNKETLETYQKLFDEHRKELNSIGKFKDKALDDDTLIFSQDTVQN